METVSDYYDILKSAMFAGACGHELSNQCISMIIEGTASENLKSEIDKTITNLQGIKTWLEKGQEKENQG